MALVIVLALAAVPVLSKSGLVGVQLQTITLEGSSGWSDGDKRTVSIRFGIRNDGWTPVTIAGVGRSSSFMKLLKIEGIHAPIVLRSGNVADVELVYQVASCNNIPQEWPIPVQVERPWGTDTVYVEPPPQEPNSSEDDWSDAWKWHAARASYVCDWHI
ncbi:hypothetical protein AB0J35_36430 [Nonomuraea angiospora]|uniref:hypothetical protein n=1 Tax=Nonomuraea angiospora TaxID=46172 RepID=UPI0034386BC5